MSGIVPEIFEKDKCYECGCGEACNYCYLDARKSSYSRKCFMTGEYCSKQSSIQSEREVLHKNNEISAFVIMSFSNMSDVVYERRIKRFIKKLKMYLAFDEDGNRICCSKNKLEDDNIQNEKNIVYKMVKKIHVERGDSDAASNYVMCSRICQRIQVADLIIVDVSHQNPNVFYELGVAIALGKMILPICYSESYYKMVVPKLIKETDPDYSDIEHHIGCYPWRKELFEYFGMFHTKSENRKTVYLNFEEVIKPRYNFSDIQYNRFPYDAEINVEKEMDDGTTQIVKKEKIGEKLYNELKYNFENCNKEDNTLLVYTMDDFLNKEDAGKCIVNFYHTITAKLQVEQCFCGDRVGVLVQGTGIPETDKDADKEIDLFYSIGEIIHIGVNQATYLSEEEKLKPDDVIGSRKIDTDKKVITDKQENGILRAIKGYIRNRGTIIYIKNPVYVKKELDNLTYNKEEKILQKKYILETNPVYNCSNSKGTCLYHKVLHSLRYVNEVVIDISNNSIYALFWLGIAHGSSVNAITVLHNATENEREKMTGNKKKYRLVFDVAGLWTAILHSDDTQGFYNQLALAQQGIENHKKLMLKNKYVYRKRLHDKWKQIGKEFVQNGIDDIYKQEKDESVEGLEAYYRSRFWNTMLRHNQLLICMPQIEHSEYLNEEPRGYTSKWDFRASAILSHYLSKRTVISEYNVKAIVGKEAEKDIEQRNFISLGSAAKPLGKTLSQHIAEKFEGIIHTHYSLECVCDKKKSSKKERVYKGFVLASMEKNIDGFYTQHPQFICSKSCPMDVSSKDVKKEKIFNKTSELNISKCNLCGTSEHIEIAQLIMWRESSYNFHEKTVFRVAINGSSGPATLGLSTIFVGNTQKKEVFGVDNVKHLLYDLQGNLRTQLMERYKNKLDDEIERIMSESKWVNEYTEPQITRYKGLVWYAVSIYLYNELYHYFLPLLSDKDIYSLCNGMYNFVNQMRVDKESPFDINYLENEDNDFSGTIDGIDVDKVIKIIPSKLSLLLKEFQGVEVFYKITVSHFSLTDEEKKREDTRDVIDIEMLLDEYKNPYVNCIW